MWRRAHQWEMGVDCRSLRLQVSLQIVSTPMKAMMNNDSALRSTGWRCGWASGMCGNRLSDFRMRTSGWRPSMFTPHTAPPTSGTTWPWSDSRETSCLRWLVHHHCISPTMSHVQEHIIPVCLPGLRQHFVGQYAFVVGWGRTEHGVAQTPSLLQVSYKKPFHRDTGNTKI